MRHPTHQLDLWRLSIVCALSVSLPVQAADILRGGITSAGSGSAGASAGNSASVVATPAQPKAADTLARTAQSIAAVQAMQVAARTAAVAGANNLGLDPNRAGLTLPNVPDGLVPGGLQRSLGNDATLWLGANLPTQATSGGQTNVTVGQTAQQALLTWQTFNVGKNTALTFDQSAGGDSRSEWIAFNKINDPTGVPSQILGSIKADGQVYVLNQNGIIFGGSSQVNAHALVASSLPLNGNLVARGLLNNADQQFLFSSLPLPAGANGTPAFIPTAALTPDGKSGAIAVQPGARLASPTSAERVGGRVALFGPNVTNGGTISTPDGQTILAAGQQIGLAGHDSNDPSLRGLDVYVGSGGGTVTNAATGLIDAPRAAVALAGKTIDQLGVVASTTSVAFNGRLDFLASYDAVSSGGVAGLAPFFPQSTGVVTLGASSVTQILPDLASTERVVGSQLALSSQINVTGRAVYLAPKAILFAPSAAVVINAGNWNLTGTGATAQDYFAFTSGQIYLDGGAVIDVAGSANVPASVTENIVSVQLRGSELADTPLQRDGVLRGQTVQIDLRQTGTFNGQPWVGTPLANTTGYIALVDRTVGQLTTGGGSVSLQAGTSVVFQPGSSVNVSGGWVNYAGGEVATTKLLADGRVLDISQATPDRIYDGTYSGSTTSSSAKWGVADTTSNPQLSSTFEPAYVQGGNAGKLTITAPAMALDGNLLGAAFAGPRQRSSVPSPGALSLTFKGQDAALPQNLFPNYSPTPPDIVFQPVGNASAVGAFSAAGTALPAERTRNVTLSPTLLTSGGFGALSIENSDGRITVPSATSITLAPGGSLALNAASIDMAGKVSAPGGSVSFAVFDRSPFADRGLSGGAVPTAPVPDATRGNFTLGPSAVLSTAGLFVDDRPGSATAESLPLITKGGSIAVASFGATFAPGGVIDASGGVAIAAGGKATYGNGGSIAIAVGQDPKFTSLLGGQLIMRSTLQAYSGATGGSLSLLAPTVQVGGTTTSRDTLLLAPEFFSAGGFNRFSISGLGATTAQPDRYVPGLVIASGTLIAPVVQSRVLAPDATAGGGLVTTLVQPVGVRAPVSLAFSAPGVRDLYNSAQPLVVRGDLVMGEGAVIQTDPRGAVTVSGDTALVQGKISAPGGTIAVSGGKDSTLLFGDAAQALPTVDLGAKSALSTAGAIVLTPDARGYRTGVVLPGGSITVAGNLVAEVGARLDVSGASGVLDLAPTYRISGGSVSGSTAGALVLPMRVDSNGGTITLNGAQQLLADATLVGAGGGSSALGGNLVISSGRFYPPGTASSSQTPLDVTLTVTQGGPTAPPQTLAPGQSAIGNAVRGANGTALAGQGYFAADSFTRGGFDTLTLKGTVQFSGAVALAAPRSLTVATSGLLYAASTVSLNAPYVALGTAFSPPQLPQEITSAFTVQGQPFYSSPTFGTGNLNVVASLVDVGNLSLQNIGKVSLVADRGDIRGDGTLSLAGDLTLRAGQIYPPSAVSFNLIAADYTASGVAKTGSITIAASGTRALPLSAGGALNVYASTTTQGGVLRAPIGSINLGWDGTGAAPKDLISNKNVPVAQQLTLASGSVTSVSANDAIAGGALTIPFGTNLNGTAWIDPTSADITVSGVAEKTVQIAGQGVTVQPGATVDLRGGGDLLAYRWVAGVGGSKDILAASGSFAVIPNYQANYAPFAPFNPTTLNANLSGAAGYVNSGLGVGDRVYLGGSADLPAGNYTLLPARYALLPGAFLVTPKSGIPPSSAVAQADGASVVAGYRFNELNTARTAAPVAAAFEVAPQSVVRGRAQYDTSLANTFLKASASAHDTAVPRLPVDSGQLVLTATRAMAIQGSVAAQAPKGGRGGLIDISSPVDIFVASASTIAAAPGGSLVLNAAELNAFGAESLLIGAIRSTTSQGTALTVKTDNITVNNAGVALAGAEVILAANKSLILAPGASVTQVTNLATAADNLLLGSAALAGSGDGTLLRVSSDPAAQMTRSGVSSSAVPTMTVSAGARVSGASVILDSTRATSLSPTATIIGQAIALDSGQITLQLANAGNVSVSTGLLLSGAALQGLQSAQSLSLLSYSSIDVYGTGAIGALDVTGQPTLASLALHAGEIRGFNTTGGIVSFAAKDILLDNSARATAPGGTATPSGTLAFNAGTLRLGSNALAIGQFANVTLNATGGVLGQGTGGLTVQGNVALTAPLLTGATAANQSLTASGTFTLAGTTSIATVAPGLGASFSLTGASVSANNTVSLPSGTLSVRATTGDLTVGGTGRFDVSGTTQTFYDLTTFTDGGQITLSTVAGSVVLAPGSVLAVGVPAGGANAGTISVSAPVGALTAGGVMSGQGGTFSLDVGRVAGESLSSLNRVLDTGGFTLARSLRVRTGNVVIDGPTTAQTFDLSVDQGAITVDPRGVIDASGATGGAIALAAGGGVTLQAGSRLTVTGKDFNSAGKGGTLTLETRGLNGGVIDVQTGATLDLSVAANTAGAAALGNLTGTLRLRAPQNATNTDLVIAPLNGTIVGVSTIVLEGFKVYDLSAAVGATITAAVQAAVLANGAAFSGNTTLIANRVLGGNASLASALRVRPGAEVVNPLGDLTLASAWDLSAFRFGTAKSEPGALTLRAAGNLNFDYSFNSVTRSAILGSLSDGFGGQSSYGLWDAPLLAAGSQSWSYRLVAGADFTAADFHRVMPLARVAADSGSLLLGRNTPPIPLPSNPNSPNNTSNLRQNIVPNYFQVIRTGTGDIDIATARDVQLLNPLATIYTAGTQANALANFDLPNLSEPVRNSRLGPSQNPVYGAQFSLAGGSVKISAQRDITRLVADASLTALVADSSKELPNNWLYRRGAVEPVTGQFGPTHVGGEIASTAWWVDFSNFFEGVGALGGGNVSLLAGRNVTNVDAAIPTNARAPKGTPDATKLVELGGGDLVVRAGGDIDGGVYYVERGRGTLAAGGGIRTNATRAALTQADVVALENQRTTPDPTTWLPTTLFLGKGSFDVAARGDLLLGPVVNPFLLPQGVNNNAYEKTYFSTYAAANGVNTSSLTGALTLRASADGGTGSLSAWFQNVQLYDAARNQTYASYSQPWLRLLETDITPFFTVNALLPGALRATAFSGDLNLIGSLTLSPAASGTLELSAAKSLNGLQPNGVNAINGNRIWGSSAINLSDADPRRLPGAMSPISLSAAATASPTATPSELLDAINGLFNESGSTQGVFGVIQTKQALHAPGPLHLADLSPARLYARSGNISGLTFFSAKAARVTAGRDVTDVALYLQNTRADDVSVVAAGRDLIAFDPNSPLRVAAQSAGNELLLSSSTVPSPGTGNPTAGDIQISGPGVLQVLAGRNFDLGVGAGAGDGTGVGITSIGNGRNPNLPFAGAKVIAGAGLGVASSLAQSALDFPAFVAKFLNPATAGAQAVRYLPLVGERLGLFSATAAQVWTAFNQLSTERRNALALDIFYVVLRDAGRDHGQPSSDGYRNYDAGFAAIAALFPGGKWQGDFSLTSRQIKTTNGGDISLFAPGGQLTVGFDVAGSQPIDQGILTEHGGGISILTKGSVNVGTSRIFTLRGGDEIIWSSGGNIAAGASSKTVQSAPPTRVLIDPQSGDVKTDLAGLATGGGIGVLATVVGVKPGDVDLIAPVGTIDAGDAGIRVSGNLNISALQVVNAANIQVSGSSAGTPAPVAPAVGGLAAAASAASGASPGAAEEAAKQARAHVQAEPQPSLITVEVIGYGGASEDETRGER